MAWEPDYVTAAAYKHYTKISDTEDDAEIALYITAASRAVDRCCSERPNGMGARRQFGQVAAPEVRYYTPRWDQDLLKWVIEVDDFATTVGMVVQISTGNDNVYSSTIDNAYVIPRPMNAIVEGMVYTQIAIASDSPVQPNYFKDSAKITIRWGWTAFPDTVELATMIQAHRFSKRRQSPGVASGSTQKGTKQDFDPGVDPDIALMLKKYVKLGWTP